MNTPRRNWSKTTNNRKTQAWADMYVSMNRKGQIKMSRRVFERLSEPQAVFVLFDTTNGTIGLQPTAPTSADAFHVGLESKKSGQRRVNAFPTMVQYGLEIPETIQFKDAHI